MNPKFLVIDLFCGAGGTTTGFAMTKEGTAKVIACVNHDPIAIESHWRNHPEVEHFEEDITKLYGIVQHGILFKSPQMLRLIRLVNIYRAFYPEAKVILWASLECTNFSKAKGGQPREADSRTLAVHMDRYVDPLNPDLIQIENVVEFMSWGPLNKKGKPISRKNGRDWVRWRNHLCSSFGYRDYWKELDSADYGAYTSRNRLFGIFAKDKMPVVFPTPTHAKKPEKSMFGSLQKWKPVKDVLDFSDEGKSIFIELFKKSKESALTYLNKLPKKKNETKPVAKKKVKEKIVVILPKNIPHPQYGMEPKLVIKVKSDRTIQSDKFRGLIRQYCKKNGLHEAELAYYRYTPLSEKTLERIYAGLLKYVAKGSEEMIIKWRGHNGNNYNGSVADVNQPSPTITTMNHLGIAKVCFMQASNGGNPYGKVYSVERPSRVITCQDNQAVVQAAFISKYYSGNPDNKNQSLDEPAGTITTVDHHSLIQANFLNTYYGKGGVSNVSEPSPTLTTKDRIGLVSAHWLDKQYGSHSENHQSIEDPAGTITSVPKLNLCEAKFLMPTHFNNKPQSLEEPCSTITANRKWHYLVNPSWHGHTHDIEKPCPVLIARQDKSPLYLVVSEEGELMIQIFPDDSPTTIKIKEFMACYGIVDIKMRMLKVPELIRIQGFPPDYKLAGNQTDQKKFIGNSVVPHVVRAWAEALAARLN